jgi:cell division protein FtsQ
LLKVPTLRIPRLSFRRVKRFPGFILFVVLFGLLIYLLGWSTLLAAKTIQITGTDRKEDISLRILQSGINFHLGQPLARVDVHSIDRKISELDWVDNEKVSRDWIHGRLSVVIHERLPIAQFLNSSGAIILLDKHGAQFAAKGLTKFPLITFSHQDSQSLSAVAGFIENLSPELLSSMISAKVNSPSSISTTHSGLGGGTLVVQWGDNSELATKMKVLHALLALPENSKAKFLDLSSPLAPIAK